MKFCLTADLHLKMWEDIIYDEYGIPQKLIETLSVFNNICNYAMENTISNVVIAGDVNDTKSIVHYKAFVKLKEIIEKYPSLFFIIISGNHDEAAKSDDVSAIELLNGPDNVITVPNNTFIKEDVTFIPWCSNLPEVIKKSKPNKFLVSHLGLSEASFSSGISIQTNITLKDLAKFNHVLLGHYHLPQKVKNVWYVGSPIQLNMGEANEEKRFLVVNTENEEIKSIPTEGYRKYHKFEIGKETDIEELKNRCLELKNKGDIISIRNRCKDSSFEIEGIKIIDDITIDFQIRGITSSMSPKEQFKKYLEIQLNEKKIKEEEIDEYLSTITESLGC